MSDTLAPFLPRIVRQVAIQLNPVAVRGYIGARAQLAKDANRRVIPRHIHKLHKRTSRGDRILNAGVER